MNLIESTSFGFAQDTIHDFQTTLLNSWWHCLTTNATKPPKSSPRKICTQRVDINECRQQIKVSGPSRSFFFFFLNLNVVISFISIVLRETTLTISDLTGECISMECEIVRVVYIDTTEI